VATQHGVVSHAPHVGSTYRETVDATTQQESISS